MLAFEKILSKADRRSGAVIPLVCLLMPVLIILAAFSINFAHMELVRTQAQIASDASARAAGRTFALTGDLNAAKAIARNLAQRNSMNRRPISLPDSAFTLGASTRAFTAERFTFKPLNQLPKDTKPNSLKIDVNDNSQQHLFPNLGGQRTFTFNRSAVSTQVEVDIALVLDRSGSMAYAADEVVTGFFFPKAAPPGWAFGLKVPPNSRWLDLVGASNSFLDYLENSFVDENVSLATYGTAATIDRGMTKNYQLIRQGIDAYTRKYPTGSTNIGDGITKGGTLLSSGRTFASKVMVVMTDGIRTAGPDPVPIATSLGKQGVIIYTVTFSNEADKTVMANVAAAGSGKHFHAATGSNLQAVFENIARSIPTIITQ